MARQHARYSPSKLGAKDKCSKFDYEQRPDGQNEAADEGELMHKAYETENLSILETEEQRTQVEKVLLYANSLRSEFSGMAYQELREVRLEVPDLTFGYADHVIYCPAKNEAHVIDAKFGRKGADAADDNIQIMCYSGALLSGLVGEDKRVLNIGTVYGHIVSPRLDSTSRVKYEQSDVPRIHAKIESIIQRAADPFDEPKPDPDLCTQCQWRSRCPKVTSLVRRTSESIGHMMPSVFDPSVIKSASPDDQSKVYALAQIVESWAEQAKKAVTEHVLSTGAEIPNYSKVKRAGNASITDASEAAELLSGVLSKEQVLKACKLSLPKLTDEIAARSGASKKEARETAENVLAPVIERGPDIVYLQRKRGVTEKDILSAVPQLVMGDNSPKPE